jgi:EmrB/QacA subfamily drug resistance transporter
MLVLDVTVVNVALPSIGAGLGLGRVALTWVLIAYTLAFGGLMLLGGRLADQFGARRVLLAGLAIFTGASMAAGLAGNAALLIGGRVAQGVGAALLSPSALSLVTTTFTGSQRNRALGIWAAIGGAGSAFGVIAGGALTSGPGWRWVFFINVPVGLLVLAVLPALVPAIRAQRRRPRIDVPGAVTVTAATGAALYGLINAGNHGWLAMSTLVPLVAAAGLYAGFALVERSVAAPLMDLRMLTRRPIATGAFLMLVATGLLVGAFFLASFALQVQRGYSALHTGVLFLPVAAAAIAGASSAGHLLTHLDRRVLVAGALTLAAGGAFVAAYGPGALALVAGISVAALGIGATFVAAITTAMAGVDASQAGVGSGIVNSFHELGGAVGVAVLSSIAAPSLIAASTTSVGFTRAFTVSAVAAIASAVIALLVLPAGRSAAGDRPMAH